MNNKFNLVQTNTVLEHDSIKPYYEILSRPIIADIIRDTLDKLRIELKNNPNFSPTKDDIIKLCEKKIKQKSNLPIKRVINATGTIMHTNLGRSPIDSEVWDKVKLLNICSNNLEYNINNEGRGIRGEFLYSLLAKLTGAEDALVVNNNAAAVFLILKTLATDKEVIVSRGEQVQIGGGFRIPDILREAGAKLVEIGTTNIVTIKDYEEALTENTAMILKVHASNFKIRGFVKHPSFKKIRDAIPNNIPLVYDEGAGIFDESMSEEEHVKSALRSGVDLVCFSGDKMFSSVQAGIIVGKKEYIERIYKHPLMRAFRCGKTVLSILEKSVIKRLNTEGQFKGYCETLLSIKPEIIKQKALKIIGNIEGFEVIEELVETGGGAMADTFYPSYAISFKPKDIKAVIKFMHNLDVPIIPKVKKDSVLIYVITIKDEYIDYVKEVLIKIKNGNFLAV
ncbi:L-seryl-tRNA(Sec) selenium transferase [Brachyspira innocens]|uniref:L-seryl-tRNA(Sec) selenium transferase n=1 Tax=Brachyspira innocens TaxID=13264 RepID=A0ABT8YX20_9SPIR|nr:L-seryl-tRNA(Sec) selenium transferase [Brachyspira innocens]MDO6992657.1 L-seryl-tRNA(Sec) selenium transferase [Brachyspira innocens]MDO7020438.1 L-seryl-tRNA(Sec) selenium transferase [Brachyspira innocens]